MMRAAFDRRRLTIRRMLNDDRRRGLRRARGRVLRLSRRSRGCSGESIRGQRPASSAELAELCIDEAKVAVVPGEAFGAPGYFRMSYALGDDDLVEGVTRLAELFAEAQD